jgi:hypothetical protein
VRGPRTRHEPLDLLRIGFSPTSHRRQ